MIKLYPDIHALRVPANLLGESALWHLQEQVLQMRVDVPGLAANFVNLP